MALRIVQLLIIVHVLAATCAWLQVARLISRGRCSLGRGLRKLLMECCVIDSRFSHFSVRGSRGKICHPHAFVTQARLHTTLFPLPWRIRARLFGHNVLFLYQRGLLHNLWMATERVVLSSDVAHLFLRKVGIRIGRID